MQALGGIIAIIIVFGFIALGGGLFWNNPLGFLIFIVVGGMLIVVALD